MTFFITDVNQEKESRFTVATSTPKETFELIWLLDNSETVSSWTPANYRLQDYLWSEPGQWKKCRIVVSE